MSQVPRYKKIAKQSTLNAEINPKQNSTQTCLQHSSSTYIYI